MVKTRVGVLLRDTVGTKSSNNSMDLENLTKRYYEHGKKMQGLISSLQEHHESLKRMEASRLKIAKGLASFTKGTPLYDCVGLLPSSDRPSNTVCSYASIHDDLAAKSKSYTSKYGQFVLDYAVEWEKIVRERIDNGIKKAKELRIELDHYQKKVESLRLTVNQTMTKGKPVSSTTQERLSRNEEKLLASTQNYNKVATDLSILMEEVVERSWRDLHPLLVKCSQFDTTLAGDEARVLSQLDTVIAHLKQVAIDNGISPQPRLKDLASLKPELLSTRPGGVVGLAIEAGESPLYQQSAANTASLPPGSVGAQGRGGFPVPIASMNNNNNDPFAGASHTSNPHPITMHRTNSLGTSSLGSAHSAPPVPNTTFGTTPPTFDDVYGALGNRSAPSSGNAMIPANNNNNMPGTPTNNSTNHWSLRSTSFNDADSAYSGYSQASAPAPMGAPPPPPPPPSSMNGYNNTGTSTTNGMSMYPPQGPPASMMGSPPPHMQQQQPSPLSMYPAPTSGSGIPPPQHGYNPYG